MRKGRGRARAEKGADQHPSCRWRVQRHDSWPWGILVGRAVARKHLSERARALGEEFGAWLAFEEDCRWAVVAYEHPEWFVEEYLGHRSVDDIRAHAADCLHRWTPHYFAGWDHEAPQDAPHDDVYLSDGQDRREKARDP